MAQENATVGRSLAEKAAAKTNPLISPASASRAPGSSSAPPASNPEKELLFLPGELNASAPYIIPDPFSTSVQVLTSLIIVLLLLFGLSWVLQRRLGLQRSVFGRVLGIVPLDGKRFMYIVDVMGKVLVLGVTEYQVSLLTEIDDKTVIDALRLQNETPAMPSLEKLFPFLRRKMAAGEGDVPETDLAARTEMTRQQREQIEGLLIRREPQPGPRE
jgi:flagellar biogenesis protein FliO